MAQFTVAAFSLLLAFVAIGWLHRSWRGFTNALDKERTRPVFRKLFPITIILYAVLGFLSVNYYVSGCETIPYEQIIANKSHMVDKTHTQLSQILSYIVVVLMLWGFHGLVILIARQNK